MKKILVLFILLIGVSKSFGGPAINYPIIGTPLRTDQTISIDDPSGTWSIGRITISSILGLTEATDISGTAWRMFYTNGSGDNTEFPLGTAGQLMQFNGVSAAPTAVSTLSNLTYGGFTANTITTVDGSGNLTSNAPIGDLNADGTLTTSAQIVNTIGTFTVPITANPYTLTAANSYNAKLYYGVTGEADLPALVDGMDIIIYNTGAFTITIDPNASEVIVRDGTAQAGGVSFTLSSGAGNFVQIIANGTQWVTVAFKGTLLVGS